MPCHFFRYNSLSYFSLLLLVLQFKVLFQDLGLQRSNLGDCVLRLFVLLLLDTDLSILRSWSYILGGFALLLVLHQLVLLGLYLFLLSCFLQAYTPFNFTLLSSSLAHPFSKGYLVYYVQDYYKNPLYHPPQGQLSQPFYILEIVYKAFRKCLKDHLPSKAGFFLIFLYI